MSDNTRQEESNENESAKKSTLALELIPKELEILGDFMEKLPEEKQNEFKEIIIAMEERISWQGPLPPPGILKEYNDALSDGAERIMRMAEKRADHRIAIEKQFIPEDQNHTRRGQNFALTIALTFLLVSGLLIWDGHEVSGTILGSVDLVALTGIFIYGIRAQRKESQQ